MAVRHGQACGQERISWESLTNAVLACPTLHQRTSPTLPMKKTCLFPSENSIIIYVIVGISINESSYVDHKSQPRIYAADWGSDV